MANIWQDQRQLSIRVCYVLYAFFGFDCIQFQDFTRSDTKNNINAEHDSAIYFLVADGNKLCDTHTF